MIKLKPIPVILGIIFTLLTGSMNAGDKVSARFENFTLKDYNGFEHSLYEYKKDAKAIVVMFIATRCPISNAYNERMVQLVSDYEDKGVVFVGINSNKQEDIDEIAEHAAENMFDFDVLKDWNNVIADKWNAKVTPEIFVLNTNFELLYHGRIDNSRREDEVETQELRRALDEILAGKEVSVRETKAFGCTIKRVSK